MTTIVDSIGVVVMLTVGVALPVLVTFAVVRSVRRQARGVDPTKQRRMMYASWFAVLVIAAGVVAISVGLEAVVILGAVALVVMIGSLPLIARADLRSKQ